MVKPKERGNDETYRYGSALATKRPGESFWRVAFAGGPKGIVKEVDDLYQAVYLAHNAEEDLGKYLSLGNAIDALQDD